MTIRLLSTQELQRLRAELGSNVLSIGAEPYIDHQMIFDVIQKNLQSDPQDPTTSTTNVTTAGTVTLSLADATGLSPGARILLDVDDAYEIVTAKAVSGSNVTVNCAKLHGEPFPVELESGLTLVRCRLWDLAAMEREIKASRDVAGITQADESKFGTGDDSPLAMLFRQQARLREELASIVNLQGLLAQQGIGRRSSGMALW